jgi:hypothetical protein
MQKENPGTSSLGGPEVLNAQAARVIDLTVSDKLLVAADEVTRSSRSRRRLQRWSGSCWPGTRPTL